MRLHELEKVANRILSCVESPVWRHAGTFRSVRALMEWVYRIKKRADEAHPEAHLKDAYDFETLGLLHWLILLLEELNLHHYDTHRDCERESHASR